MSVEYIKRLAGPYVGDGTGQKTFSFGFLIFDESDVYVAVAASSDSEPSDLQQGTDYTVSMNADQSATPGGTITLTSETGLAKDAVLVIGSAVDYTQTLDLTNYTRFAPERITTELDRIVVMIQQIVELLGRVVQVPPTSSISPSDLFFQLLTAAESAAQSAEDAAASLAACEQIRQLIEQYSWDIPHIVDSLRDVEKYPYDGLFAVAGFGNAGGNGQNISNRYVKAEGSTKLRTLGERFADVVNVKDFGAIGNGVHDDTAAIQAALSNVYKKGGGVVYFPPGTYGKTDVLHIGSGTTFLGYGATIKNLANSTNNRWAFSDLGYEENHSEMISYTDNRDIFFYGITFDTAKGDQATGSVAISYADNILFRECTFKNVVQNHAVELMSCSNVLFEFCTFAGYKQLSGEDAYGEAIQLDASYEGAGPVGSWNGLPCKNVRARYCRFTKGDEESFGSFNTGIGSHWDSGLGSHEGIVIEFCEFDSCGYSGVAFRPARDVTISGCVFKHCKRAVYAREFSLEQAKEINANLTEAITNSNWLIQDSKIIASDASSPVIQVGERLASPESASSLKEFCGLKLDGIEIVCEEITTGTANVLDLNRVNGLWISRCHLSTEAAGERAFGTHGLYAYGCRNVTIQGNNFDLGNAQNSFTFAIGSTYFEPENVCVIGNTILGCQRGVNAYNVTGISVTGNRIKAKDYAVGLTSCIFGSVDGNVLDSDIPIYTGGTCKDIRWGANTVRYETSVTGGTMTSGNTQAAIYGNIGVTQDGRVSAIGRNLRLGEIIDGTPHDVLEVFFNSEEQASRVYPIDDGTTLLGGAARRFAEVFAVTGAINTSDARQKSSIEDASGDLMTAWGSVPIRTFQFADAVCKKGEKNARVHVGFVAQEVQQAFETKGLDAARYGLFCHDEWPDRYETVEVVDQPEALGEDGEVVTPAVIHTERRKVLNAGDRYGLRYEEALCLEAAYQRYRADKLEERLAALERRMTIVEAQ